MFRFILFLALSAILLSGCPTIAQELLCRVSVNTQQLSTAQVAETAIFTQLEKDINSFMNNQKWTDDNFGKGEQIKCALEITLTKSPQQNVFEGNAQIKATRTVYNTTYETTILSYIDQDFNFQYVENQPLVFNLNNFSSNLTSMLAFYAYVALAMDYDSFSPLGGNPYVENAFNIVNIAQQANQGGWRRNQDTKNRFWLAENLNSQQMLPFREAFYNYHRMGMDIYLVNAEQARQAIYKSIQTIGEVNKLKPSAEFTNIFFDAKYQEIYEVFKQAPSDLKIAVRKELLTLDPGHTERYNQLLKN